MIYPKVFGFASKRSWELSNTKIKLVDTDLYRVRDPFYITSVGPCRIWWEWRRVNKSTR